MAKGKKTIIKDIKKISDDTVEINGKQYIIIEDTPDIQTAITMKITSHGNRILRFEDVNKIATIDVKREINIVKYTILDTHRASRFRKFFDTSVITLNDKTEILTNTTSVLKAREILNSYKKKDGANYDKQSGITTFYVSQEIK